MKVALTNGILRIKDFNTVQFNTIKTWNRMTYQRKEKQLVGYADLELLDLLGQLVPLSPKLQAERDRLEALQNAVDRERFNENPQPIIPMPIKANPFKHQIRGYNMALMVLGIVEPPQQEDK